MVNPRNTRNKKEHFDLMGSIKNIIGNETNLMIIVVVIVLIIGAILFYMYYTSTHGSSGMNFFSDTSPMAPLTATPEM